jgi:hypothetical protein
MNKKIRKKLEQFADTRTESNTNEEYRQAIIQMAQDQFIPEYFMVITFYNTKHLTTCEQMLKALGTILAKTDRRLLGRGFNKIHHSKRTQCFATIESIETNPHLHILLRKPADINEDKKFFAAFNKAYVETVKTNPNLRNKATTVYKANEIHKQLQIDLVEDMAQEELLKLVENNYTKTKSISRVQKPIQIYGRKIINGNAAIRYNLKQTYKHDESKELSHDYRPSFIFHPEFMPISQFSGINTDVLMPTVVANEDREESRKE